MPGDSKAWAHAKFQSSLPLSDCTYDLTFPFGVSVPSSVRWVIVMSSDAFQFKPINTLGCIPH